MLLPVPAARAPPCREVSPAAGQEKRLLPVCLSVCLPPGCPEACGPAAVCAARSGIPKRPYKNKGLNAKPAAWGFAGGATCHLTVRPCWQKYSCCCQLGASCAEAEPEKPWCVCTALSSLLSLRLFHLRAPFLRSRRDAAATNHFADCSLEVCTPVLP